MIEDNNIKINLDKCHLFVSGHKLEDLWAKIGDDKVWETGTVKLLGITIDNKLKFDELLNNACLRANRKFSALMRIRKFLRFNKTRMLFKGLFDSRLKYCPLTCMFYSRNPNHKINLLHERTLKLVYNDYKLPFEKKLEKDDSFTVHHYNIRTLCIELCKVYYNIAQTIFSDLFISNNNTCVKSDFLIHQIKTVFNGSNSV